MGVKLMAYLVKWILEMIESQFVSPSIVTNAQFFITKNMFGLLGVADRKSLVIYW